MNPLATKYVKTLDFDRMHNLMDLSRDEQALKNDSLYHDIVIQGVNLKIGEQVFRFDTSEEPSFKFYVSNNRRLGLTSKIYDFKIDRQTKDINENYVGGLLSEILNKGLSVQCQLTLVGSVRLDAGTVIVYEDLRSWGIVDRDGTRCTTDDEVLSQMLYGSNLVSYDIMFWRSRFASANQAHNPFAHGPGIGSFLEMMGLKDVQVIGLDPAAGRDMSVIEIFRPGLLSGHSPQMVPSLELSVEDTVQMLKNWPEEKRNQFLSLLKAEFNLVEKT